MVDCFQGAVSLLGSPTGKEEEKATLLSCTRKNCIPSEISQSLSIPIEQENYIIKGNDTKKKDT